MTDEQNPSLISKWLINKFQVATFKFSSILMLPVMIKIESFSITYFSFRPWRRNLFFLFMYNFILYKSREYLKYTF